MRLTIEMRSKVIVNGTIVMRERTVLTMNEEAVLREAQAAGELVAATVSTAVTAGANTHVADADGVGIAPTGGAATVRAAAAAAATAAGDAATAATTTTTTRRHHGDYAHDCVCGGGDG